MQRNTRTPKSSSIHFIANLCLKIALCSLFFSDICVCVCVFMNTQKHKPKEIKIRGTFQWSPLQSYQLLNEFHNSQGREHLLICA